MFNRLRLSSKYSNFLTILLIIIIILIVVLLGIWGYNVYQKHNVETGTQEAIKEFESKIGRTKVENEIDYSNVANPIDSIQAIDTSNTVSNTPTNQIQTYKGFIMLGYIEIPKTKIKLPILEEVTPKSLEASVGILYSTASGLNKPGNTVIAGHNYRNGLFFSDNYKIQKDDIIYITDTNGNKLKYIVYHTYTTTPEDADYMERDTYGTTEISLTTCTDDSSQRIIIWARAE